MQFELKLEAILFVIWVILAIFIIIIKGRNVEKKEDGYMVEKVFTESHFLD